MVNKSKIMSPQDSDDVKLVLSKACDLYNKSEVTTKAFYTKFLSPLESAVIMQRFPKQGVKLEFFGGYEDAERCICAFCFDGDSLNFPLVALRLKPKSKNASLGHRDYLGTALSLGIKRETIGDIIIKDDYAIMFCLEEMADYIADNLTKIGGVGVGVTREEFDGDLDIERNFQVISATVSSLRCDSVISAALKTSRSRASEVIERGLVTHNYEIVKSAHRTVADGDTFSVRGSGKFKVQTDGNLTKKGRIHVNILKYI